MNRNSFFKASLAVGIFLTAPFAAIARINSKKRVDKVIKVDSGKDRFDKPISLFEGDTFYTKISTADTDGDIYVFESTRVKEGGPSFYLHYEQDEFWSYAGVSLLFFTHRSLFLRRPRRDRNFMGNDLYHKLEY